MTRVAVCPFCGYNLPVRRYVQYCPVCDERIEDESLFQPYQPLEAMNYSILASPRPRVAIREWTEPDEERDPEAEAIMLVTLLELRPWFLRSWFVGLMLFFLTPLGILLLWAQRPRVGAMGGVIARSLVTFLFGGAWSLVALTALTNPRFQASAARLATQAIERLDHLDQPFRPVLVTRAAFEGLHPGDLRAAVLGRLGGEPRCIAKMNIDTTSSLAPRLMMETFEWRNPDGSTVNIVFENGRLSKKMEFGLPR